MRPRLTGSLNMSQYASHAISRNPSAVNATSWYAYPLHASKGPNTKTANTRPGWSES
jgi:hypothetical protein